MDKLLGYSLPFYLELKK